MYVYIQTGEDTRRTVLYIYIIHTGEDTRRAVLCVYIQTCAEMTRAILYIYIHANKHMQVRTQEGQYCFYT